MLEHIRVLDFTNILGALAGRMFVEMGAQVIKVEPPSGDPQRQDPEAFTAFNHGKRSVIAEAGSAAFNHLLASADIVLRNPGMAHSELLAVNPALIDVVISPFAAGGDNARRQACDLTLMARSGLISVTGDPDRPPLKLPGEQAYALGAIQAVTGGLTALHARGDSKQGQRVDISVYQSIVLANYREPLTWGWTGRIGQRTGNLLVRGKSGVRQVWPCKDGFVTWALVDNASMMRSMVTAMGTAAGELAEIKWQEILVADVERSTLLRWEAIVEDFFLQHSKAKLGRLSQQYGLGLSCIDGPDDVLDSQHLAARSLWQRVEDVTLPGPLWSSSLPVAPVSRRVPALGEAQQSILGAAHDKP